MIAALCCLLWAAVAIGGAVVLGKAIRYADSCDTQGDEFPTPTITRV